VPLAFTIAWLPARWRGTRPSCWSAYALHSGEGRSSRDPGNFSNALCSSQAQSHGALDIFPVLALADAEHLGPTLRACASDGRPFILQGDILRVLDLYLHPVLETICLHVYHLLSCRIQVKADPYSVYTYIVLYT